MIKLLIKIIIDKIIILLSFCKSNLTNDLTLFSLSIAVAQFMYIVRRRISLPSEKAMFLFVNKVLPTTRSVPECYHSLHSKAHDSRITP